jgi:hypothetical protein
MAFATDGPTDPRFVAHAALRVGLDRAAALMRRPDGLP